MSLMQQHGARSVWTRLGVSVIASALVVAPSVLVTDSAQASDLTPAAPVAAGELGEMDVATLLSSVVDPLEVGGEVKDVEDVEVEFAEAVVPEDYTETGPVSEQQGNEQQIAAVEQALAPEAEEQDLHDIARIDINANVAVVGVTWDLNAPEPEAVHWRYLVDGVWSEWAVLESDTNLRGEATRAGTEPLSLAGVDAVEVVAKTAEGVSVPGLALHVINAEDVAPADNALLDIYPQSGVPIEEAVEETPQSVDEAQQSSEDSGPVDSEQSMDQPQSSDQANGDETSDKNTLDAPAGDVSLDQTGVFDTDGVSFTSSAGIATAAGVGILPTAGLNAAGTIYDTGYDGLKIGTRKAWCTGECQLVSSWAPQPMTIKGAVVHHTQGYNNYTQAEVPQQLRNTWQYQAITRGWGDIGYNLLVDKYGGVWEGRYGGLTNAVMGAHAYGTNYDAFGITIMGDFREFAPPTVARQAMSKAIAWKLNLHGIKSATEIINVRAEWAGGATVPRVSAHRQVGNTDCPGDPFFAQMDLVRSEVNAHLAKLQGGGTSQPSVPPVTSAFNPGNVISDSAFYNGNAMNEAQIEAFIKSTGANCVSTGSATCLKDLIVPAQKIAPLRLKTGGCSAFDLTGNQRAWTVIDRAAKACNLNPQVILVTLQKEQSGLTQPRSDETWAKAMGSGCPDNSGCDPAQGGFVKQIYYGTEKLATYHLTPNGFPYIQAFRSGTPVTVQHNLDKSCGTQTFTIQNNATASLYTYTPYIGNSSVDSSSCYTMSQKMFWDLMKRYFPATLEDGGSNPGNGSGSGVWTNPDGSPKVGWILDNGTWYYTNSKGQVQTGWLQDAGLWYYLGSNGAMQTGFITVNGLRYYMQSNGAMVTGWQTISGNWYFFTPSGAMMTGWFQQGTSWYYFNPSTGVMQTGWATVGGKRYYMNSSGVMLTGWQTIAGERYYLDSSGAAQTGWVTVGANKYFMDRTTGAMKKGWVTDGGKRYYLNSNGLTQTGWLTDGGNHYFLNSDGSAYVGWLQDGTKRYYMDSTTGAMQKGWVTVGGKRYYLDANGVTATGWLTYGGNRYFLNSDGSAKTGWMQDKTVWYYFDASGAMQKGWVRAGGWFYMDQAGQMQTGWLKDGTNWYYLNSNGLMAVGWKQLGQTWYFMDTNGVMKTGWKLFGTTWYYFTASGAMKTGWLLIGNTWYYMNSSGAMVTGTVRIDGKLNSFAPSGAWLG